MNRKNDENAKDPRWEVPVELPHVEPEEYQDAIRENRRSTFGAGPPDYTLPGYASGSEVASVRKKRYRRRPADSGE